MPTPHIQAQKGDISKFVLMPGDPLRAKFIAETFLEHPRCINEVRNMLGYTGTYRGKEITVMASGMGMPSIGIYSYELYQQYDVESIIRIGSAGAYVKELNLYDVVLAERVFSDSSFARCQNGNEDHVILPDRELNEQILAAAQQEGIPVQLTTVHSSDVFYAEANVDNYQQIHAKHQCTCVEMESFALFHNARVLNRKAACLLTISDSFCTQEKTSAEERQTSFTNMMKAALAAAL